MKVSFIGLGKLGLPLACCLAEAGNEILGVDKNEHVLDKLNNGELPFFEPGLKDLWENSNHKIFGFTDSYEQAIRETDATVILVNTQLGDDGYADDFVVSALTDISLNLKRCDKDYHLIVLSSTVLPGTITKKLIPLVEDVSGKKYGKDFGFSYVPDFVKLGSVIWDFKNPEFFIVGSNNSKDLHMTVEMFKNIHENESVPEYHISLEETEICKVALNAYVVSKITFANFLGRLCDNIDNVNVHNVTKAIGNDKRISPYFFSSGPPYGGTCFPRDAWAFIKFAKDCGLEAKNLMFSEEVNHMVHNAIVEKTTDFDSIGVLGVSFKPKSPVTIGSPSVSLIDEWLSLNKKVYAYDPLKETYDSLHVDGEFVACETPDLVISKSDIVVVMHPDSSYTSLDFGNKVIVDPWGVCV
tara:strand:+ start:167 stop:1402 length:1236 start_codon:yes stop_codon:yes gene_type:complete